MSTVDLLRIAVRWGGPIGDDETMVGESRRLRGGVDVIEMGSVELVGGAGCECSSQADILG